MEGPTVAIVGLGAEGVAIGRALRRVRTDYSIIAHDRDSTRVKDALRADAADRGDWSVARAAEAADFIVLAEPIEQQIETISVIAEIVRPGALVAGVYARLAPLLAAADAAMPAGVSFIATNLVPARDLRLEVAGRDRDAAAVEAERAPLEGATWCLAPARGASDDAVRVMRNLVGAVGAEALFIDADEHDALVAGASRLPRVAYAALARVIARSPSANDLRRLVDPTLRELLGTPDPAAVADIADDASMLLWLDQLVNEIGAVREALVSGDEAALKRFFDEADAARALWSQPSAQAGAHDVQAELREIGGVRNTLFGRWRWRWRRPPGHGDERAE